MQARVIRMYLAVYAPFLSGFFQVQALSLGDFLVALGASALVFLAMEVEKFVERNA